MSSKKKGIYNGEDNPNFGNRWDEKQKSKMRGANNVNSKLCEEDVVKIKKLLSLGYKHAAIAEKFDVSRNVVTRINTHVGDT
jgi:hypothetical protein